MHVDLVEKVADLGVGGAAVEVSDECLLVVARLRITCPIVAILVFLATEKPGQALSTSFLLLFPANLGLAFLLFERFLPLGAIRLG